MRSAQPFRLAPLLHLMRIPHWLKNGLVLAPLLFSRSFHDVALVHAAAIATLAFCLLASAIYVWNDLRDADADRRHQQKQRRPLAAGAVSRPTATALAVALALLSLLLLLLVPQALPYAAGYAAINILYSAWLKHWPWMDLLLTAGYVLRVFAGAGAAVIGCYVLFTLLVRPQLPLTVLPAVAGVLR